MLAIPKGKTEATEALYEYIPCKMYGNVYNELGIP